MKTIEVTLTVRDEQGVVIYQDDFMRASSQRGWQCGHDVWSDERVIDEREDLNGVMPTCGWCESQGRDGTLREVEVVECELCKELYEVEEFYRRHVGECGT